MNTQREMLVLSYLKFFFFQMTTQEATNKVYANDELVEMIILSLDEIHGLSSMLRETD